MRLAKLTLNGFKSFADRTEFTFDDSMTGIVGPNGCGKSNVVDAIKWVLGERSSKSLRGKEMIDVIFAGSAGRKPAGMASVVLSFDNPVVGHAVSIEADATDEAPDRAPLASEGTEAPHGSESCATRDELDDDLDADSGPSMIDTRVRGKRVLPIDADEVAVERRLYRDGTSQYLINNKKARLRDIRELFLDTGVGADAYSIIEQGKVDAMLLASPQERRTIFEEAAGVSRFKIQKKETLRKLERTDQNLSRVTDLLEERARRIRSLRIQAGKARRYQELQAALRDLRAALAVLDGRVLRQTAKAQRERLDELQVELASADEGRDVAAEKLAVADEAITTLAAALATVQDELRACENELTTHKERAATQRHRAADRLLEEEPGRRRETAAAMRLGLGAMPADRRESEADEDEVDHVADPVVEQRLTGDDQFQIARRTGRLENAHHRDRIGG